jgi:hypothetical protein
MDIAWKNDAGHYVEGVQNFLDRRGIKEEAVVEELRTMGPYKVFKLGFLLSTSD